MKLNDILVEAFDSDIDYTIVRANNELFTTKAVINGRTIMFNAQANEEGIDEVPEIVWEVDFYEKSPGNMTYGKSRSGGEMKVFSFVLSSLKELSARYSPETIRFSSYKADHNRTKLYHRMISRIAPSLGFKLVDVTASSADDIFVLKKV